MSAKMDTIGHLFSLDLEELINLKVSVASKNTVSLSEAPGVISAYSKKHINQLGYYSLKELSNITPGYSSYYIYGEQVYETRGRRAGSFNNNKHLTLVDGIPINFTRNYKSPMDYELPLFFASKVEFLKGPASSLYGISAFYGVVSLTSKGTPEEKSSSEFKTSFGTANRTRRIMASSSNKTENGNFSIHVGVFDKQTSGDFVGHDSLALDSAYRNWDNQTSVFMYPKFSITKGNLKGITVGSIFMRKTTGLGEFWYGPSSQANSLTWQTITPYIKYELKRKNIEWNNYIKFQNAKEKGQFATHETLKTDSLGQTIVEQQRLFSDYLSYSMNLEVFSEAVIDLPHASNLRIGVNYDVRKELGDPVSYNVFVLSADSTNAASFPFSFTDASLRFHTLSSFAQLSKKFDVLKGLDVIAGIRQDFGYTSVNNYLQFSPRLGLVQRFSDQLNFKLLYSTALRSPGIKEVGLNDETKRDLSKKGLNNDFIPEINAEIFKSLEGSLVLKTNHVHLSSTLFINMGENSLDGVSDNNVNFFRNSKATTTVYGVELEAKGAVTKNFYAFANYYYATPKDDAINEANYVLKARMSSGLSYTFNGNLAPTISLVNKSMLGYNYWDENNENYATTSSVSFFDINILLPLTSELSLEVHGKNVLDTDYKQPGGNGARYDIPIQGRWFYLSLDMKF